MKNKYKINSYSFGKIVLSKQEYISDLIIFPDKIIDNWRREKGHLLQKKDINSIINYNPEKLIIGTGKNGKMRVSKSLLNELYEKNITTEIYKTDKAVKKYNNSNNENIICALHLSC